MLSIMKDFWGSKIPPRIVDVFKTNILRLIEENTVEEENTVALPLHPNGTSVYPPKRKGLGPNFLIIFLDFGV